MFPVGGFSQLVGGEVVYGEGSQAGDSNLVSVVASTSVYALEALLGQGEVSHASACSTLGIPQQHFGVADDAVAVSVGHAAIVALHVVVGLCQFLAVGIGVGGEHAEHGVVGSHHGFALVVLCPPIYHLGDVAIAVLESNFRCVNSILARPFGIIFPELDFAPGIAPAAIAKTFKAAAGGELRVVVPTAVNRRVVNANQRSLVIVVAHGVNLVPLVFKIEAVFSLFVYHFLGFLGSQFVIILPQVERIAGHGHVDGREGGLCSLLGNPSVHSVVVARSLVVTGGEFSLGILQVVHDELVYVFHLVGLLVRCGDGRRGDERQRSEDAHEIIVGVGAPIFRVAYGDVLLRVAHGGVARRFNNQVGCLDNGVVVFPGGGHALVVVCCAERVQLCASLFVRAGIGSDVVALPLRVHHVGPALCEVHLLIECRHTAVQCSLRVEVVARSEQSFGVFFQKIVARGGKECCHHASHEYFAFHCVMLYDLGMMQIRL